MAERYDPLPDLALLLDEALRAGWYPLAYVERLADGLGLEACPGPEAAEKALREALGAAGKGEACTARSTAMLGGACGQPAAGLFAGTCELGHAAERYLCTAHAEPEEPLWCMACYALDGSVREITLAIAEAAQSAGTGAGK